MDGAKRRLHDGRAGCCRVIWLSAGALQLIVSEAIVKSVILLLREYSMCATSAPHMSNWACCVACCVSPITSQQLHATADSTSSLSSKSRGRCLSGLQACNCWRPTRICPNSFVSYRVIHLTPALRWEDSAGGMAPQRALQNDQNDQTVAAAAIRSHI